MKQVVQFIKITVAGGFFVVLPVVLVVFLMAESFRLLFVIVDPVAQELPLQSLGGIEMAYVLVFFFFTVICFLVGLVMGTQLGSSLGVWLSQNVLDLPAWL